MATPERLTETVVKELSKPSAGNRITYDPEVKGFGVRVTSAGARSFILNYRAGGQERRYTIGSWPDWKVGAARDEAKRLKKLIDVGQDPMAERHEQRAAPTVNELANRFEAEHLPKKRPATRDGYGRILRLYIRPAIGKKRVVDLRHADIDKMHRDIVKVAPYQANRAVAVVSKMLSLSVKWEMRSDNPAKGIERAPEERRDRFLSAVEMEKLAQALSAHREKVSANAVRLLMLTGARKGEMLAAQWAEFDLAAGTWVKPSAHTKTKKEHRVPLSAPAVAVLTTMKMEADMENGRRLRDRKLPVPFVFPGAEGQPLGDIKHFWAAVCRDAGLGKWVEKPDAAGKVMLDQSGRPRAFLPNARIHDLRHSYAGVLASAGISLPIIGRLLGHTQAATTDRYAHLLDDPLRRATEMAGAVIADASSDKAPRHGR